MSKTGPIWNKIKFVWYLLLQTSYTTFHWTQSNGSRDGT